MSKQLRLAVAFPAYGGNVVAQHARMWLELGACLAGSTDRFMLTMFDFVDMNPVDRARNICLARAFMTQADWLLMIDADTWVEGYEDADAGFQLCRMISEADHMGVAIVIAPVVARVAGGNRRDVMAYRRPELPVLDDSEIAERMRGRDESALVAVGYVPIVLANEHRGLVPINAGATAVMAINLAKIGETMFRFPATLGEDSNFCEEVGALQASLTPDPVRCDTRVRTGHASRSFPLYSR